MLSLHVQKRALSLFRSASSSLGRTVGHSALGLPLTLSRMRSTAASQAVPQTTAILNAQMSGASNSTAAATPQIVGWWLMGCSASVFTMVVIGGITRLTRSGLSMTDWRPQGKSMPRTDEEWEVEFDRYKQFPEYKRLYAGESELPIILVSCALDE